MNIIAEDHNIITLVQDDMIEKSRIEQGLYKHIFIFDISYLMRFRFSIYENGALLETLGLDYDIPEVIEHTDVIVLEYLIETILSSSDGYIRLINKPQFFIDDITIMLFEKHRIVAVTNESKFCSIKHKIIKFIDIFYQNLLKITMFYLDPNDNVNNGNNLIIDDLNGKFKLEDIRVMELNNNFLAQLVICYFFNYTEVVDE